jgi:hypothetical protein
MHFFLVLFFFAIFGFLWKFIKNMGQKLGSNSCPFFSMLTKQKFLDVLHSKLVKKKRSSWLTQWSTQPRTSLFKRKWSHYLGWPTLFEEKWSIFKGDLLTHSHWSIFTGDLPKHTRSIFRGHMPTHTHAGLFSQATCPHILTLVYFHGRPALLIGLTWDPIWRSLLTRTKTNMCVWSHCNEWPTQKKWWSHCDRWPTQVKKITEDGLIVMGDLPRRNAGLIMMGDLPRWKMFKMWIGLIVMGDLPKWKIMVSLWWVT